MKSKRLIISIISVIILGITSQVGFSQTVSVSKSIINVNTEDTVVYLNIKANTYWGIYGLDSSWISLDTTWGYKDTTVKIYISQNTTKDVRIDTLHVYCVDSNYAWHSEVNVVLAQATSNCVSDTVLTINSKAASTAILNITTSMYWEITGLPSWLTVDKNWKQTSTTVTFTADENPCYVDRTDTISINCLLYDSTYKTTKVVITQKASLYGVNADKILVADSANAYSILMVKLASSWTVSTKVGWISLNKTSSSDADSVKISVTANNNIYYRADTVTIISGSKTYNITVIQNPGQASLNLSPWWFQFDSTATSASVSVTSNTNWGFINLPYWLNTSKVFGYGDSTFTLTVDTLPAVNRTDSVEVYWFDADNGYHSVKTLAIFSINTTGIQTLHDAGIVICPNPVKDSFSVKDEQHNIKTVYIIDKTGRQVRVVSSGFESIDISNLPSAVYSILIYTSQNKSYSSSIIKINK